MTREEKVAALAALAEQHIKTCRACILHAQRRQAVPGEGDPCAQLVFVGEGPGEEEDRTGRPFVGRAGQLLDKMIAAMGLRREQVYICNVVKCRPPGNRTPEPAERVTCMPYLVRQLQIIAPKVIVALGNPAMQTLLDTREGITRMRGNWQKLGPIGEGLAGIPVMPTFHPAFILRSYNEDTRGKVWSDLQKVMELLGLRKPGKKG
ncbi:MAG: uracil-DNA glycosylase family protein [Phycisphaerae bacterium]